MQFHTTIHQRSNCRQYASLHSNNKRVHDRYRYLSMKDQFSRRHRFSEWPNAEVPAIAAGVYAIWEGDVLVYCGMSGRSIESAKHKKKYGLITRLSSHASGRLSGDQFCVYVANRLVIPALTSEQLPKFATGELMLDVLTKSYINERFEYQFMCVQTSLNAFELEMRCRSGEVFNMKPLLNPTKPSR